MAKLIVLVAVVAAAWWMLKRYLRSLRQDDAPPVAPPEDMVRCAHCGVHLPRSESLIRNGRRYCSEEHSQTGG